MFMKWRLTLEISDRNWHLSAHPFARVSYPLVLTKFLRQTEHMRGYWSCRGKERGPNMGCRFQSAFDQGASMQQHPSIPGLS